MKIFFPRTVHYLDVKRIKCIKIDKDWSIRKFGIQNRALYGIQNKSIQSSNTIQTNLKKQAFETLFDYLWIK